MPVAAKEAWRSVPTGLQVAVRLTPKGGRDAIEGIERRADGACVLKARVRAAPQNDEANAALRALLARTLGVPASRVRLVAGGTTRIKRLDIDGDPAALAAVLAALTAGTAA